MAQWQVAIQEQVLLRVVLMVSAGPGYRLQDDLQPGSRAASHTFCTSRTVQAKCVCLFFALEKVRNLLWMQDSSVSSRVHVRQVVRDEGRLCS